MSLRSSRQSGVGNVFFSYGSYMCPSHALFNSEMVGKQYCGFYATSGRYVVIFHGKEQKDGGWSRLVVITVYIYLERPAY